MNYSINETYQKIHYAVQRNTRPISFLNFEIRELTTNRVTSSHQKLSCYCKLHNRSFLITYKRLCVGKELEAGSYCPFCMRNDKKISFYTFGELKKEVLTHLNGFEISNAKEYPDDTIIHKKYNSLDISSDTKFSLICKNKKKGCNSVKCEYTTTPSFKNLLTAINQSIQDIKSNKAEKRIHIPCKGDCCTWKLKRTAAARCTLGENNSTDWVLSNPETYTTKNKKYWITHKSCVFEIFVWYSNIFDENDNVILKCPICDEVSPLKLLDNKSEKLNQWLSIKTNQKLRLTSLDNFPKDSNKIGVTCKTCNKPYFTKLLDISPKDNHDQKLCSCCETEELKEEFNKLNVNCQIKHIKGHEIECSIEPNQCHRWPKGKSNIDWISGNKNISVIREKFLQKIIKDKQIIQQATKLCEKNSATYIDCLGIGQQVDNYDKHQMDLIFFYKAQNGYERKEPLYKMVETYCGSVTTNRGEQACRAFLKTLLPKGTWLTNIKPDWNLSDNGNKLELDIVNHSYKVALERQSDFHTGKGVKGMQSYEEAQKQLVRDSETKNNCKKNGYKLIYAWTCHSKFEELGNEICKQLYELNIITFKTISQRNLEQAEEEFFSLMEDDFKDWRIEFESKLAEAGKEIVYSETKNYRSTSIIQVKCSCGNISKKRQAINFYKKSNGTIEAYRSCNHCKVDLIQQSHKILRKNNAIAAVGGKEVYDNLSVTNQKSLNDKQISQYSLTCSFCAVLGKAFQTLQNIEEHFKEHNGYFCAHCHNTGKIITDNHIEASWILHAKHTIDQALERFGKYNIESEDDFFLGNFISIKNTSKNHEIILNLKINESDTFRGSLYEWRKRLTRTDDSNFLKNGSELKRIQSAKKELFFKKIYPNATI
ncbi:hypothetical protein JCM30760_21180 [Thiomicrorhabdus hydrogeniphila]